MKTKLLLILSLVLPSLCFGEQYPKSLIGKSTRFMIEYTPEMDLLTVDIMSSTEFEKGVPFHYETKFTIRSSRLIVSDNKESFGILKSVLLELFPKFSSWLDNDFFHVAKFCNQLAICAVQNGLMVTHEHSDTNTKSKGFFYRVYLYKPD